MNLVQVIFTTRWYAITTRPKKYFDCERFVNEMYEKIINGDHITENKHSLGDCDEFQDNFLSFHLLGFFVPLEIFFYSY